MAGLLLPDLSAAHLFQAPVLPGTPLPTDAIITMASFSLGIQLIRCLLQRSSDTLRNQSGMREGNRQLVATSQDGISSGPLNVRRRIGLTVNQQVIDALGFRIRGYYLPSGSMST